MRHTAFALNRPITTIMVFFALALVGIIGSRLLPLEMWPDIEFPGIFVQVPYPGSTPEEIEQRITRPIEESLATLSGVEQMRSRTTEDQVELFLQFDWDKEMGAAGIEARAKVDAIRDELPDDVERIFIFTGSLSDQPILVLRISSERDLSFEYDLIDRLVKRRIERLDGVSKVELHGVDPREIRILLDADRVAAHGVDLNDLRVRLMKSNFAVSAGQITDAGERFSVRPLGEFRDLTDIENVLADDSGNLRVRDIADVSLIVPERSYGRHLDRQYAIGLQVFKQTGANMVDVAGRVKKELESIRDLPQMQGINIFDLQNQAEGVRSSLADLRNAGLIGAVLAILVLFLFLRQLTTTLVVISAIPVSLLITLAAMYFFGLSLNILSMMGLMLAIGMLVDNGVVVTESIFRYRQLHPDEPFRATMLGVKEVGVAVVAGTFTSIIVFVPVMFGVKTDITVFLTHVAVTIAVAMLASLVIAQTLVPTLAARVKPPKIAKPGSVMNRVTETYTRLLNWTLNHPWWTALGVFLVVGLSSALIGLSAAMPDRFVKFDAWPQETSRRLFLPYHIEGTHSLDTIERAVYKIEDYLYGNQEELDIVHVYSYFDTRRAESTILLTDKHDATVATTDVIERIKNELPEIVIGEPSFQFEQQGGSDDGFSLQISGESTEELARISDEVVRVLKTVEGLESVRSDASDGEQEIQVVVDRDRAIQQGMSTAYIAGSIQLALRGQPLREFRSDTGEISVRLTLRESDRQRIEDLKALPLFRPDGEQITLGSVADFQIRRGARDIRRVDRSTSTVIEANLAKESTMDGVKPRVENVMKNIDLPAGYQWKFGRGFDRHDETQQIMMMNILLGIVLIFIVMAALFESILYPLSIITSIVFAIFGVFWMFWLTDTTFSFMASIGIMILIGVVVNNGIVLIDHINNLRREGMARRDAILQGGRDRLRPILMTVVTTIVGLLPLAVSTTEIGGDGPPYFPMARAIIGGLAFSTVVSLLVVPVIYVWLDSLSRWMRKLVAVARPAAPASRPQKAR